MNKMEITITLNQIEDLNDVEVILKSLKISAPIFIVSFEDHIRINFTSDHEYYELNTLLREKYNDYTFINDLGGGNKELRIKIRRYHSPFSTDGWGRPVETPLDETIYLIKKSESKTLKLNPKIKVLFENTEHFYYINIIPGIKKNTEEKGFLVRESFENLSVDETNNIPFIPKLHQKLSDAYWSGFNRLTEFANEEFEKYLKEKKKQGRKREK